jgi:hypothetical protein
MFGMLAETRATNFLHTSEFQNGFVLLHSSNIWKVSFLIRDWAQMVRGYATAHLTRLIASNERSFSHLFVVFLFLVLVEDDAAAGVRGEVNTSFRLPSKCFGTF